MNLPWPKSEGSDSSQDGREVTTLQSQADYVWSRLLPSDHSTDAKAPWL